MKKVTKPEDLFPGARLWVYLKDKYPMRYDDFEYLLHKKDSLSEYSWTFTCRTISSPILGVFNGSSYDYYVVNPKDTEIFTDTEYEELWV